MEEDIPYLSTLSIRNRCKVFNLPLYKMPLVGIAIKRRSQQYIPNLKPVSEMKETLGLLKQEGYNIGFTTSNNQDVINEFLIHNSIDIFDYHHFSFSPFSKSKDISSFLKKYDVKKEDVVYVGDELRDIKAAKKNGLFSITVSWGFDSVELLNTGHADKVITHPKEIVDILSRLS